MNTTVGDLDGNRKKIVRWLDEAHSTGADLVLFPELAVTGYPPEDLLLRPGFVRAAAESLRELARETRGLTALVGFPHFDGDLYNACAVCSGGEVKAIYRKRFLPNYGVFDEDRYFAPARDLLLLEHGETLSNELEGRIPVFFFSPGLVRTAMLDDAPDDLPWTPPELAPRLVRVLASGRADGLAGRYIHAEHDDIEDLIRRADEIRENDLNAIRLRR